jgi:hypothetical protein
MFGFQDRIGPKLRERINPNESGSYKGIHKNKHVAVPVKADVELELNKTSSDSSSMEEKRFSVILPGMGSVSRLN